MRFLCECGELLTQAPTGRPREYCSARCRVAAWRKRTPRLRGSFQVMTSSRSDDWPTDPAVFAALDDEFGFDLDPCSSHENHKCERYFTREDDGLARPWTGRVFCNPPYGRGIGAWVQKAWESAESTAELVVLLIPARTDTRWWHEFVIRGEVRFVKGRLRFGDMKNVAPFPSAIVVFRNAAAVTEPTSEKRAA